MTYTELQSALYPEAADADLVDQYAVMTREENRREYLERRGLLVDDAMRALDEEWGTVAGYVATLPEITDEQYALIPKEWR